MKGLISRLLWLLESVFYFFGGGGEEIFGFGPGEKGRKGRKRPKGRKNVLGLGRGTGIGVDGVHGWVGLKRGQSGAMGFREFAGNSAPERETFQGFMRESNCAQGSLARVCVVLRWDWLAVVQSSGRRWVVLWFLSTF